MLAYSVIATFPDQSLAAEYVAWLKGGHVQQVVAGGAVSAEVIHLEEPPTPIQIESRYIFAGRAEFDRYLRDHAPRLRTEGLARFGAGRGVTFQRRVGKIV